MSADLAGLAPMFHVKHSAAQWLQLLADTELAKNFTQQIVGGDFTGN
jgi:hypothetical protein